VKLLREQVNGTRGVLLVTHDLRLRQFAHRIIEIDDGRLIADYPVSESRSPEPDHA
jgi:ABC-type lipoprotein export system ATPase subunit